MKEPVIEHTWEEFRSTGLLLIINQILHIFGWAIVVETDGDKVRGYPARVTFRGFGEDATTSAYLKVGKYLAENAEELLEEAKD